MEGWRQGRRRGWGCRDELGWIGGWTPENTPGDKAAPFLSASSESSLYPVPRSVHVCAALPDNARVAKELETLFSECVTHEADVVSKVSKLDMRRFLRYAAKVLSPSVEAEADFCFQLFDKDSSGKLDKAEVWTVQRAVCLYCVV